MIIEVGAQAPTLLQAPDSLGLRRFSTPTSPLQCRSSAVLRGRHRKLLQCRSHVGVHSHPKLLKTFGCRSVGDRVGAPQGMDMFMMVDK